MHEKASGLLMARIEPSKWKVKTGNVRTIVAIIERKGDQE
jgi:hypothetical protein